jgi:hypothetical protein
MTVGPRPGYESDHGMGTSAWLVPTEVMEATRWAFEHPAEMIATAVVVSAIVTAALGLLGFLLALAIHWSRCLRDSTRTPEALFVGRFGDHGPELFLVGKRVRRLSGGKRQRGGLSPAEPGPAAVAFAEQMLAEVMQCQPAQRLAQAFAEARLAPVPEDGFVLSSSDVEAWLHGRQVESPRS